MPPTLAIVGATGAVGREFLSILEQRRFPHGELRLLASARSAGTALTYRGEPHRVEQLTEQSFRGVHIALFSAGSGVSKQLAPAAVAAGAVVVDNSSAFRMDPAVPLVIPEVNPEALQVLRQGGRWKRGIIANPNCSTIILLMAATPLRRAFGIERMVVSTYQAVSGAGAAGMQELEDQTRAVLSGERPSPRLFAEPCAFNVFSHNSAVDPHTGRNVEEEKMIAEARKIWDDAAVRISPTCIRVPTMRAHAESVNVTLWRPATEDAVRAALAEFPGVRLIDDRAANDFPTPLKAAGGDETLIGRVRPDDSQESIDTPAGRAYRGFNLFVCADQLRKGAALNAVQIAEMVVG
jgi:aspartate-semialdehyde dehydrogenase